MSDTTTPTVVEVTKVTPKLPTKLTAEEVTARYRFIGMCVDRGIVFPNVHRFGVQAAGMSVQDLCNSNIKTLQDIAVKIKKEEAGHDPEFSGTEELKISGVPAQQWLDFFRLTIRKKSWDILASEKRSEAKLLKAEIAAALTPEEKRKKAEEQLKAIDTEFTEEI